MSELPPNPDEKASAAARRGIRWDALAAIIASLVGLLALIVAGYTAYVQRQQVRAQVWPYLLMETDASSGNYAFVAANKGVSPVIVENVQLFAAGKPVKGWTQLYKLFDFQHTDALEPSDLNHVVMAPGDRVRWMAFQTPAAFDAFGADWARFDVDMRVCYSSTLGESWLVEFRWNTPAIPRPVSGCPRLPKSAGFFD